MAVATKDGRYMPALAVMVLLILAVTAWWLYGLNFGPAGKPAAVEMLLNTQAASLQAGKALAGEEPAWTALRSTSTALNGITTATLTDAQRATLGGVRDSVQTLLDGQGDVLAVRDAVNRIQSLQPDFTAEVYALQGELSIQRQPVAIAHLERLRLLGETTRSAAAGLLTGDARLGSQLLNADMELRQIVRSLQAGDPQLGIAPVSGEGTKQALASLARRADQLGVVVADGQRWADALMPLRNAQQTLEKLVLAMEGERRVYGDPSVAPSFSAEYQRLFALLAAAAFMVLVMLVLWFRASGHRQRTAQLAAQTEQDQQAILRLLDELSSLADGDLTVHASVGEDVTGAIADSINFAVEALRELVETINQGAILVEDATKQTEASATSLAEASDAQSKQIKHAGEAIQQMVASIDEVSGDAERSADVARHSVDIAHKGGDAVRRTIEGMNTIRETIQETSKRIKRLGESSQEIGNIVELINDIADQTNILALNASIQASSAGEAGRGFAVVADEVQRLAERSTNATKQIEVLVSTIQSDTNEAVVSMERSTTDVVGGALLAENAGAALEEIEQVSNQIAMLVQNITSSAREQTDASRKVLESAERLEAISKETDASAVSTTEFISQLAELAAQLRESVSGFILPGDKSTAESLGDEEDFPLEGFAGPEKLSAETAGEDNYPVHEQTA